MRLRTKLMSKHLTLFAAAFFGLLPATVTANNLVSNPGFETGDFSGWTLSGTHAGTDDNGIYYGVDGLDAHTGQYGAYFGPVGGILELSQTFSTVPGVAYTVNFWLAHSPETPFPYLNSFAASFGGTSLISETNFPESSFGGYFFSGLATSTSTNLVFAFRDDASFFSLDDVSVTSSSVPEPASVLLVVLATIALFLGRQRLLPKR